MNNDKKKIRVAVLGLRGIPDVQGGVEKHCQELYPRLVGKNCEITILARAGYVDKNSYTYKGVQVIPLSCPKQKSTEAITHTFFGLLWLARHRRNFDIIHLHAIGPALLAPLARLLGLRVVMTNHGPDYDRQKWGMLAKKILKTGERLGARYAHGVICVSNHIRSQLQAKYSISPQYIPNGVTIPAKRQSLTALHTFGLEPGKYILAVGRLVPEKGFHDLLEAYAQTNRKWKLVIVGRADHEDTYSRKIIQRAEAIEGAVMAGFQTGKSLEELYSHAGLFVLPSFHEGLPIVALEAMSYSLPFILSDIPANREVGRPEETFPPGNQVGLARKISSFLANPAILDSPRRIQEKRDRLQTEFNWDLISAKTASLYRQICTGTT